MESYSVEVSHEWGMSHPWHGEPDPCQMCSRGAMFGCVGCYYYHERREPNPYEPWPYPKPYEPYPRPYGPGPFPDWRVPHYAQPFGMTVSAGMTCY
ncbi:MAG: hypothetical protein ABIB97_03400 [Patescibacteria group bacterium]